jgi:hypothetical protein
LFVLSIGIFAGAKIRIIFRYAKTATSCTLFLEKEFIFLTLYYCKLNKNPRYEKIVYCRYGGVCYCYISDSSGEESS